MTTPKGLVVEALEDAELNYVQHDFGVRGPSRIKIAKAIRVAEIEARGMKLLEDAKHAGEIDIDATYKLLAEHEEATTP